MKFLVDHVPNDCAECALMSMCDKNCKVAALGDLLAVNIKHEYDGPTLNLIAEVCFGNDVLHTSKFDIGSVGWESGEVM